MWIAIGAWCAAAVIAAVLLGFCAYEIIWKARRLGRDVQRLQVLAADLDGLRDQLAQAQERVAAAGLR